MKSPCLVWFRRDLRLSDNPALTAARESGSPIIPIFIWETEKRSWEDGAASKVWLHHSLLSLDNSLQKHGSLLHIQMGDPFSVIFTIMKKTGAKSIFWNRLYEPYFIKRDAEIEKKCKREGYHVETFQASLWFAPKEILSKDDTPYRVFTPFWKTCQKNFPLGTPLPAPKKLIVYSGSVSSVSIDKLQLLPKIHWEKNFFPFWKIGEAHAKAKLSSFLKKRVKEYVSKRDYPVEEWGSYLSPHLHFGEISPRQVLHMSQDIPKTEPFLRQIAWREFAQHLLYFFPYTESKALRKSFHSFPWKMNSRLLQKWQRGVTGYPIVDAGMRQLWKTGWMHNRVRMIVASFLVKDLMIPWQEGAQWFWDTLVDADLANNTLGWQWVAGCGADAAPYFRIFNPVLQGEKFDPDGDYVRTYVPEIAPLPSKWIHKPWKAPSDVVKKAGIELGSTYPFPIVDHDVARANALKEYRTWVKHEKT